MMAESSMLSNTKSPAVGLTWIEVKLLAPLKFAKPPSSSTPRLAYERPLPMPGCSTTSVVGFKVGGGGGGGGVSAVLAATVDVVLEPMVATAFTGELGVS